MVLATVGVLAVGARAPHSQGHGRRRGRVGKRRHECHRRYRRSDGGQLRDQRAVAAHRCGYARGVFLGLNAVSVAARGAPDISSGLLWLCRCASDWVCRGSRVTGRIDARHLQGATLLLAGCGAIAAIAKGLLRSTVECG